MNEHNKTFIITLITPGIFFIHTEGTFTHSHTINYRIQPPMYKKLYRKRIASADVYVT